MRSSAAGVFVDVRTHATTAAQNKEFVLNHPHPDPPPEEEEIPGNAFPFGRGAGMGVIPAIISLTRMPIFFR